MLSKTSSWYVLQYHQRYSLWYATYATHVSTPPTLLTLAHHPRHPHWHVTHGSTSPMLARRQRKLTIHSSRPPTQARYLRHPRQHKQHAISQTHGYPNNLLKLLVLKFQEEIFLEETSRPYSKDDYFFINKCAIFQKKLFPIISVVSAILYILSLEKQFIKNQYYLYYKF